LIAMADEASNLRMQWQKQVEYVTDQLGAFESSAMNHQRDLRHHAQQRLDDMQMMEQALSTVQTQQIRLNHTLEEGLQHTQVGQSRVMKKYRPLSRMAKQSIVTTTTRDTMVFIFLS
jgi:hypothetical protein